MILNFNQIGKNNVLEAGGKGANLGELVSIGINVPDGFIITSDAYKLFIKENGIVDKSNENGLSNVRTMIENGKFPITLENLIKENYLKLGANCRVAVRSSATAEDLADASFAGQQETYLNVQGTNEVISKIKSCYASLWSDRAVSYRKLKSYEDPNLAIAVVIQKMVESEKSGVLFTINPINKRKDEMLIDASYGLGESVVSGRVTADSYVIDKYGKIIDINVGKKETQIIYSKTGTKEVALEESKKVARVLSSGEISKLSDVALKIEKHYGYPLDIEWALKGDEVYILQARPITTLKEDREIPKYITNVKIKKHNRELMSFLIEKIPFVFKPIEFDYFTVVTSQKEVIFKNLLITGKR